MLLAFIRHVPAFAAIAAALLVRQKLIADANNTPEV
jgi:hypothetical protein